MRRRTMNRIQRAPKSVQRLVGSGQNFLFAAFGMLRQPPAPSIAVRLVSFLMYLEIR